MLEEAPRRRAYIMLCLSVIYIYALCHKKKKNTFHGQKRPLCSWIIIDIVYRYTAQVYYNMIHWERPTAHACSYIIYLLRRGLYDTSYYIIILC